MTKNLSSLITNTLTAGSSGKNYIATSANTSTGWTSSNVAQLTVATSTTGSELPRASTTLTGIKITPISSTAYAYARFTLDAADAAGMPQLVTWAQKPVAGYASGDLKVDVYTNTASDYSGTYTRVALTTDVSAVSAIPNLTGQYATKFMPATTPLYYEVRITRVAGTTALVISDGSVGPQALVQGAGVGAWQSATMTVGGTTSAPAKGTTTEDEYRWRRVGDSIELSYSYKQTAAGTAGTGTYLFPLPLGLHIDTSVLAQGVQTNKVLGHAYTWDGTSERFGAVTPSVTAADTTNLCINIYTSATGTANVGSSQTGFNNTNCRITFHAMVPISEWSGSGTQTNLVQADCEYAYNTSTATTTNDTTSFGYGPGGAQIQAITAFLTRRVRFKTPIQATDALIFEVSANQQQWVTLTPCQVSVGGVGLIAGSYIQNGGVSYGAGALNPVSGTTTDVDVTFGQYAYNTSTYGAAGTSYAGGGASALYWRVKKLSGGTVAGVAEGQPGVAAGLVGYYGTKGRVDGSALTLGYVGEVITSSLARSSATSVTSATAKNIATGISLTAGVWMITGAVGYSPAGTTTITRYDAAISRTSATMPAATTFGVPTSGEVAIFQNQASSANGNDVMITLPPAIVSISATTPFYLVGQATFGVSSLNSYGSITAVRIA